MDIETFSEDWPFSDQQTDAASLLDCLSYDEIYLGHQNTMSANFSSSHVHGVNGQSEVAQKINSHFGNHHQQQNQTVINQQQHPQQQENFIITPFDNVSKSRLSVNNQARQSGAIPEPTMYDDFVSIHEHELAHELNYTNCFGSIDGVGTIAATYSCQHPLQQNFIQDQDQQHHLCLHQEHHDPSPLVMQNQNFNNQHEQSSIVVRNDDHQYHQQISKIKNSACRNISAQNIIQSVELSSSLSPSLSSSSSNISDRMIDVAENDNLSRPVKRQNLSPQVNTSNLHGHQLYVTPLHYDNDNENKKEDDNDQHLEVQAYVHMQDNAQLPQQVVNQGDKKLRHREVEKNRHRQLQAMVRHLSERTPGKRNKETQVQIMKRAARYCVFLGEIDRLFLKHNNMVNYDSLSESTNKTRKSERKNLVSNSSVITNCKKSAMLYDVDENSVENCPAPRQVLENKELSAGVLSKIYVNACKVVNERYSRK